MYECVSGEQKQHSVDCLSRDPEMHSTKHLTKNPVIMSPSGGLSSQQETGHPERYTIQHHQRVSGARVVHRDDYSQVCARNALSSSISYNQPVPVPPTLTSITAWRMQ